MLKIPLVTWIANAAVGLTGLHGDVTRQAGLADCSRQTIYDHAHKVQAAVVDAYDGGPTRAALIAENQRLARENAQLWQWLEETIEFPVIKQHEFAATAAAMGLSLNQILVLLALILGQQAGPGRSTLHRWIKLAGLAAGRVLKLLDARCRALVLVGCLDEIFFHGRPVLVGVEPASLTWSLGQKAEAAFAEYERSEAGWKMARGALAVFGPEGRLNDRTWASQQIALALPLLSGGEWSKVRGLLRAEGALTFLDRLHRQLGEAVAEDGLRAELVRLWWLRRQRPRAKVSGEVAGAGHVMHLVQEVLCQKMDPNWRVSYGAVSRVLRGTVRASSAVECMNSVLRMHQSRHRTVSQGLLDLKRLYWNCREFREGKRRRRCPYELLGLELPRYRIWDPLGLASSPWWGG